MDTQKLIENERRAKLMREKPYVMEKILKYDEKRQRGESTAMIDFCYDYKCNMNCAHCSNRSFAKKERELTLKDVNDFFCQADKLGLAQVTISGGEPLVFDNLDDLIASIDPSKFHIAMSTNGLLLSKETALHLKSIGLDKVKVSIDSVNEEEYAKTRKQTGSLSKAIQAMFNAKEAGLQPTAQTVMSHQTCQTEDTVRLAQFCQENGFNLDVIAARAVGQWEGKEEVLLTPEDAEFLIGLNKKYPLVHRDTFPTYTDKCGSCGRVDRILHLTKYGDIMPCVFIHISIGNIFEESLEDIIKRGQSIKHFVGCNPLCLSGEDRNFIQNYMSKFYGKPLPLHWSEAFTEEDFIEKV